MTAKEYLQQACRLDQKINSDLAEVIKLRDIVVSIGSYGLQEHNNPNHATDAPFTHALEKVWDMEQKINAEIDTLVDLKQQIKSVIDALPNMDERMVLTYRYIHNMTWEMIGHELDANRTTVYRWHNSALNHVILPEKPIMI